MTCLLTFTSLLFLPTLAGCSEAGLLGGGGDDDGGWEIPPPGQPPGNAGPGTSPDPGGQGAPRPSVGGRPVIYQLVVRLFGNKNGTRATDGTLEQNGVGRFSDVNDKALAELRDLGITHVWLTGVLRQATLTDWSRVEPRLAADDPDVVKGRAGSFYAIRDYYDVCPDYADDPARRLEEFDALVKRIHDAGLRVVIDLVPNHVARGYGSVVFPDRDFGAGDDQRAFFSPSNSFYYLVDPPGAALRLSRPASWAPSGVGFDGAFARENGGAGRTARATGNNVTSTSPAPTDWYETIKLNFGVNFVTGASNFNPPPSTWTRVDDILAYWQARGVDGFRCDFAHYVPDEAWRYLISRARERDPDTFFFAEAYDRLGGLLAAGFDAVYHDAAYDTLKEVYLGRATHRDFQRRMDALPEQDRGRYLHYLENHDERRIASPLVTTGGPDDSGFGGPSAGRQLSPLLYFASQGPILFYNGQEVGEPGAGREGFGGDDGRTSIFDYWSMPAFVGWVNGGAYDGGGLTPEQRALRAWYGDLLELAQDPSARGAGYWGLDSFEDPFADAPDALYSFARFAPGSGRLLLVVANFAPGATSQGRLRIPDGLAQAAGLPSGRALTVRRVLDETGAVDKVEGTSGTGQLANEGIAVAVPDQAAHVFVIE